MILFYGLFLLIAGVACCYSAYYWAMEVLPHFTLRYFTILTAGTNLILLAVPAAVCLLHILLGRQKYTTGMIAGYMLHRGSGMFKTYFGTCMANAVTGYGLAIAVLAMIGFAQSVRLPLQGEEMMVALKGCLAYVQRPAALTAIPAMIVAAAVSAATGTLHVPLFRWKLLRIAKRL